MHGLVTVNGISTVQIHVPYIHLCICILYIIYIHGNFAACPGLGGGRGNKVLNSLSLSLSLSYKKVMIIFTVAL